MTRFRTPTPTWFDFSLDRPQLWEQVRWAEDDLFAFFTRSDALPGVARFRDWLFAEAANDVEQWIAREEWTRVDVWTLVAVHFNAHAIRRGIESCLPPPYDAPLESRLLLYFLALDVLGGVLARPGTVIPSHVSLVDRALRNLLAAPHVDAEIDRRAREYPAKVGLFAVVISVSAFLREREAAQPSELDGDVEDAMRNLGRLGFKRLPDFARKKIAEAEASPTARPDDVVKHAVDRQAFETCLKELHDIGLPEQFARALQGDLRFLPRAITRDCIDEVRRLLRFAAEEGAETIDDEAIQIRLVEDGEDGLLGRLDARHIIDRFLADHPEHRDGIALLLNSDEPRKDLAKACHVTVQTIINRRNRAWEALKRWADKKVSR